MLQLVAQLTQQACRLIYMRLQCVIRLHPTTQLDEEVLAPVKQLLKSAD